MKSRAWRRGCSSFRRRMSLGEEAKEPPPSSRDARVGRPVRSRAQKTPGPHPSGAASAPSSRPWRRRADVRRRGARASRADAKRSGRAPPRRIRCWPTGATAAPSRRASALQRGQDARVARSPRIRRGPSARRSRAKWRAQWSRKTSREPVIGAMSRYLSRPSAMRRFRVATQFLGLRSRTRLKG